MSYHPRMEDPDFGNLITTRCRNSEMWFANNRPVEAAALGYLAKYRQRYGVKLYAFALEGSHTHKVAVFPNNNRSDFQRDFNSTTARAVTRLTPHHPGGGIWQRRYSQEFLPDDKDIEEWFFYVALQPILDGLVEKLSEYPFYNFFDDAVWGIERKFQVVNWEKYHKAKLRNPRVRKRDFTEEFTLKYERLPGYEHLPQKEYAHLMYDKLEQRRITEIAKRRAKGQGFMGREALLQVKPGTPARNPKTSTRTSHRPRVLSVCPERRKKCTSWYFNNHFAYKDCSRRYRAGELTVEFPPGMYKPYVKPPPTSPPNQTG